jgi:hypothetical protein
MIRNGYLILNFEILVMWYMVSIYPCVIIAAIQGKVEKYLKFLFWSIFIFGITGAIHAWLNFLYGFNINSYKIIIQLLTNSQ